MAKNNPQLRRMCMSPCEARRAPAIKMVCPGIGTPRFSSRVTPNNVQYIYSSRNGLKVDNRLFKIFNLFLLSACLPFYFSGVQLGD